MTPMPEDGLTGNVGGNDEPWFGQGTRGLGALRGAAKTSDLAADDTPSMRHYPFQYNLMMGVVGGEGIVAEDFVTCRLNPVAYRFGRGGIPFEQAIPFSFHSPIKLP